MDGVNLDEEMLSDDALAAEASEGPEDPNYVPDPRTLWGSEAARALLVVLTRRLGPDFAREVSDELASRTFSYQAGCPDDRSDGQTMQQLLQDKFWDRLFAEPGPGAKAQ